LMRIVDEQGVPAADDDLAALVDHFALEGQEGAAADPGLLGLAGDQPVAAATDALALDDRPDELDLHVGGEIADGGRRATRHPRLYGDSSRLGVAFGAREHRLAGRPYRTHGEGHGRG